MLWRLTVLALAVLAMVSAAVLQRLASLRCASCPTADCCAYVASGVLDISLLSTCSAALGSSSRWWVRCAVMLAALAALLLSSAELALLHIYGQVLSLALLRLALQRVLLLDLGGVMLDKLTLPSVGAAAVLLSAILCAASLLTANGAAFTTVVAVESPMPSSTSRRRRVQLVCFASAASVARLALRSDAPSAAVVPRLVSEGWTQWTAGVPRQPRPRSWQPPPRLVRSGPPDDSRRAGVVLVLLESLNAADVTPLYAPVARGDAPTAPWLSALAARRGSSVGRAHLATMPNSNKALFELLTGLAPEMSTSWPELDDLATRGRGDALRQEALPGLLKQRGWASMFACPAGGAGSIQTQLGFDEVWDANALWHLCRRRQPAACRRLQVTLSARCLRRLRADHGAGAEAATVRSALRAHIRVAAARALKAREGMHPHGAACEECLLNTPCLAANLSGMSSVEPLMECVDSPCLLEEAAVGTVWPSPLSATADQLMVRSTLEFVNRSLARAQPFFATIFSTATHHPYVPPLLSHELHTAARKSARYRALHADEPLRAAYHAAIRRSDDLLAAIYAGLQQLEVADRTLLVVLGDHGEAFGDDGFHMHGGCITLSCMRVCPPMSKSKPALSSARSAFRQRPQWQHQAQGSRRF